MNNSIWKTPAFITNIVKILAMRIEVNDFIILDDIVEERNIFGVTPEVDEITP